MASSPSPDNHRIYKDMAKLISSHHEVLVPSDQRWKMALFDRFFPAQQLEPIFVSFWCLMFTIMKKICNFLSKLAFKFINLKANLLKKSQIYHSSPEQLSSWQVNSDFCVVKISINFLCCILLDIFLILHFVIFGAGH